MKVSIFAVLICIVSCAVYADVGAPWGLKMVALDNGETRHIKYNVITGETYWSKNTEWEKIKESAAISSSTYEFQVVSTGLSWRAIRIDKLTGKAWKHSSGKWIEFTVK